MEALGWRTIHLESKELAIRVESGSIDIIVILTDLTNLWCSKLSNEEIANQSKKFNPLLEASPEKLRSHLFFLLSQRSTELEVSAGDDVIIVKLRSKLDSLPFVWKFALKPESSILYVTRPLLALLKESANIQEELCTIIRNKDKEIDDYKASGAAVSRKQLLTEEFNRERYFKERRWRSLEESVKHDPVEMFCNATKDSNTFYNEVVKRISERDELKNAEAVYDDSADVNATKASDDSIETSAKEVETGRSEAIRKRLQEEEKNAIRKLTQKKKPKLF